MTINEACELVIKVSILGKSGNFYVFNMGESLNILQLAKRFVNMHGLRFKICKFYTKKNSIYDDFVPIVFTGLQRGEKMREELAYQKDLIPTKFDKILISKETFLKVPRDFIEKINKLENYLIKNSDTKIKKYLLELI